MRRDRLILHLRRRKHKPVGFNHVRAFYVARTHTTRARMVLRLSVVAVTTEPVEDGMNNVARILGRYWTYERALGIISLRKIVLYSVLERRNRGSTQLITPVELDLNLDYACLSYNYIRKHKKRLIVAIVADRPTYLVTIINGPLGQHYDARRRNYRLCEYRANYSFHYLHHRFAVSITEPRLSFLIWLEALYVPERRAVSNKTPVTLSD
jgi:hypothetical protein